MLQNPEQPECDAISLREYPKRRNYARGKNSPTLDFESDARHRTVTVNLLGAYPHLISLITECLDNGPIYYLDLP